MPVNPGLLPNDSAPIDNQGGLCTQEWRDFFLLLADGAESEELASEYQALADRVAALEQDGGAYLPISTVAVGVNSVTQSGTLAGGYIAFSLVGDSDAPGNSFYYGTDDAGDKSFYLLQLDALSDVDLTTVPPTSGDALVFDGTDWVPGAVLSNPMTTEGDIIVADVGGVPDRLPIGAVGEVLTVLPGPVLGYAAGGGASGNGAIGATFDGGGAALTPGVFTDVFVPFNCTIVGATLLADTTGNLVVSVLADPYASFPPTTDLAPTTPPTITASDKSQDTTLSGWSTAITAGDVVRLGVVSCSSITRATLSLEVTKP